MNKQIIAIIVAAVGGVAGSLAIIPKTEVEEPVVEQVEETVQEKEEPAKEEEKPQEKPAETPQNSPQKPAQTEVKTQPKSEPKPIQSEADCMFTSAVDGKTYNMCKTDIPDDWPDGVPYTYYDYEKTILGTCPSQRDRDNSWEQSNRLNALNIISSGDGKTTPYGTIKHYVEVWWNSYKRGIWDTKNRHLMAAVSDIKEFDGSYANHNIGFYIDFGSMSVSWDNVWSSSFDYAGNANSEKKSALDKVASDGTTYLRWLDSAYTAKCPND